MRTAVEGREWDDLAHEAVQERYVEFYQEPNGDFLCVWTQNGRNLDGTWSGRVDREAVPAEWLRYIGE